MIGSSVATRTIPIGVDWLQRKVSPYIDPLEADLFLEVLRLTERSWALQMSLYSWRCNRRLP